MNGHGLPFPEEQNMDLSEPRAKPIHNQYAGYVRKKTHSGRVRQKEENQGDEIARSTSAKNELS